MTQIISHLSEVSEAYDALFVDLWGCVHDGLKPFPSAVDALLRYRAQGGKVVLVTNSPRPLLGVERQVADIGVPQEAWDAIATSGDSARSAMYLGAVGQKVFHIGKPEEGGFFEPPALLQEPLDVTRVPLDEAEGVVCTGPFDSLASPYTLRPELLSAKIKGLKLLCANPDIVVDRGTTREWCAGAVAKLYTEMGGESLYFGKPHPPIYDLARRRLAQLADVSDHKILAIGDGPHTDVVGALGEGLDVLFITGGLAAAETGTIQQPDDTKLRKYLEQIQMMPKFAIGFLR